MNRAERNIKVILEVIQWILLAAILFACLFICPRVTGHLKEEKANRLYQQIYSDQRIQELNRENLILIDSLSSMSKDTVYITHYKVIKQVVYVDTTKTEE